MHIVCACIFADVQPEQRISLDQLVQAGGVTVQKLTQQTHVVPGVQQQQTPAQPQQVTASHLYVSQSVTSPESHSPAVIVQKQPAIMYDKPDTTTDEASLLNYQVRPATSTAICKLDMERITVKNTVIKNFRKMFMFLYIHLGTRSRCCGYYSRRAETERFSHDAKCGC